MLQVLKTPPTDPENWKFVVTPEGTSWVALSSKEKEQKALDDKNSRYPSIESYQNAVRLLIHNTATRKGYPNEATLASYTNSTISNWASEAKTFLSWRDEVWSQFHQQFEKINSKKIKQPTVAEFIAELPKITW